MTEVAGITYSYPTVVLLQDTGIGTSEVAARSCYDSFELSENPAVKCLNDNADSGASEILTQCIPEVNSIESSKLLDGLAWTYFHHSVLEHANLTYLIRGTSRAVLQEQARHRLQAISVRSTRYTMQHILHAFNACSISTLGQAKHEFFELLSPLDMFVVKGVPARIEIDAIYDKLIYQLKTVGSEEFSALTMSKTAKEVFSNRQSYESPSEIYAALCAAKDKRNVGDPFKWIVTDMWKVDLVVTFNLRSLRNYFELRDSGAAYFGIQHLAKAMKDVTPQKYLDLIIKGK